MNPDQIIAHLNGGPDCKLVMELTITKGRGYLGADKARKEDMPIGSIAVDAIYTPVERVNMTVDDMTAMLTNHAAESINHMKDFYGVDLHITKIRVLPALTTLCGGTDQ